MPATWLPLPPCPSPDKVTPEEGAVLPRGNTAGAPASKHLPLGSRRGCRIGNTEGSYSAGAGIMSWPVSSCLCYLWSQKGFLPTTYSSSSYPHPALCCRPVQPDISHSGWHLPPQRQHGGSYAGRKGPVSCAGSLQRAPPPPCLSGPGASHGAQETLDGSFVATDEGQSPMCDFDPLISYF